MSGFVGRFRRGRQDGEEAPTRRQRAEGAELDAARDQAAEEARISAASAERERVEKLAALPLWTDSHCHLQTEDEAAVEAVLERARNTGTRRIVLVGTDEPSSRKGAEMAVALSGSGAPPVELWATAGLHPHDAKTGVEGIASYLSELAITGSPGSARVVAVGECGLDYHYDHSPRDKQRKAFGAQIALAHKYNLALVIHTRDAWDDTFAALASEGVPDRLVFHCFSGGPDEARRCLDIGAYLSFSGIVTFANATELREAAILCPASAMLVETDAPFLTPVPHRGKPNDSGYVPLIGASIAKLKGMDEADLAQATTANASVVFNLHG